MVLDEILHVDLRSLQNAFAVHAGSLSNRPDMSD